MATANQPVELKRSKSNALKGIILAGVTVVALAGGSTLAYLTDTDAVTNEFTAVTTIEQGVTITEPNWDPEDGKDIVPGKEVSKDPRVNNESDTAVWSFVEVKVPAATGVQYLDDSGALQTGTATDMLFKLNPALDTDKWEEVANLATTDAANADGNYVIKTYAYKTALEPGQSTDPLYQSVAMLNYIGNDTITPAIPGAQTVTSTEEVQMTGAEAKALQGDERAALIAACDDIADDAALDALDDDAEVKYTKTTTSTTLAGIEIVNTQYSIQKEGFETPAEAWAAYSGQAEAVA